MEFANDLESQCINYTQGIRTHNLFQNMAFGPNSIGNISGPLE